MPWFDCAVRRPISTNTGGGLGPNLGLMLHHAVMNGSLFNFFNTSSNQVSAHFWVSRTGVIEQYVDTNVVAWHARQANTRWVGVETEGCTTPPYAEPMTQEMVNALAKIYAEGNRRHGWPFRLTSSENQSGFGFHRMAVNTACPCDVRLNRRQEILNIAAGVAPIPPEPPPIEEREDEVAVTQVVSHISIKPTLSFCQVGHGALWHKWSQDNGWEWHNELLIGSGNDAIVKAPELKESVSIAVLDDVMRIITEEKVSSRAWLAQQGKDAKWDIRPMP